MAPSPTIRRLLKETAELSPHAAHPNPTFHASPISDTNLHEWHFTLLGPPSPSPYAGGMYHGRISLPPAYPMKPPNFRFLTPSGRFEVNREICLSISGFHEETWQPAWGVRTALVALRGFMGEDGTAGQVGGLESSEGVRRRMAGESRGWRCGSCGTEDTEEGNLKDWTNEERMKWWWGFCREKGVNVENEVEGMEKLPEGMKVEARDVKADKGKRKEGLVEERKQDVLLSPNKDDTAIPNGPDGPPALQPTSTQPLPGHIAQCQPHSQPQTDNIPSRTLPQPPTQPETSSTQDTTSSHPISPPPPTPQQQPRPGASRLRQIQQLPANSLSTRQRQQADSPITIDRAITVVFLALCIMILKKVFYPSSTGSLFGTYDDLRMVRE